MWGKGKWKFQELIVFSYTWTMNLSTLKPLKLLILSRTFLKNAKWRIQLLQLWLYFVSLATERVHVWVYSDYDVFIIFISSYVSHSALVFNQHGIWGMWKRFIDNIMITMITSKKSELVFLMQIKYSLYLRIILIHMTGSQRLRETKSQSG